MQKGDWMSVLDMKAPFPRERRRWIVLSIVMYCRVYSPIGILALILVLEVLGYERWKIVHHFSECFFEKKTQWGDAKISERGV